MYHFFVDPGQIGPTDIAITGSDVNHIRNVLRMQPGEQITVSSGEDEKEYRCEIRALSEEEVTAHIMWVEETGAELPSRISLFQGLPKADKMELVIQKAVELGAYELVPMATRRAVVKLDAKKEAAKLKRWSAISESAAKQAKRGIVPEILPVMSFAQALDYAKDFEQKLLPYECAEGIEGTRRILSGIQPGQKVAVFIGPEGGFDEKEVEAAKDAGFQVLTLGRRILRTETAGMMLLSVLGYLLEE